MKSTKFITKGISSVIKITPSILSLLFTIHSLLPSARAEALALKILSLLARPCKSRAAPRRFHNAPTRPHVARIGSPLLLGF